MLNKGRNQNLGSPGQRLCGASLKRELLREPDRAGEEQQGKPDGHVQLVWSNPYKSKLKTRPINTRCLQMHPLSSALLLITDRAAPSAKPLLAQTHTDGESG